MSMTKTTDTAALHIAVVGGGAAGLMAAIHAARLGAAVTLFEKNERLGFKLRITGKGRCNVTNHCTREEFFASVTGNARFLYSAWGRFSSEDTEAFFEELGVPLKVERGNRVFPVSDKAGDVVESLVRECRRTGVRIQHATVRGLIAENGHVTGVTTAHGTQSFDAVIVATGGASYPKTGSTGDGYAFARAMGHTVVPPTPSLVPLVEEERFCATAQGLSLRNVRLSVRDTKTGKSVFEDFGELLFTHYGLSGPLVLSASAHLTPMERGRYVAYIDLKPALDEKTLDTRLLSDFKKYQNRDFANALCDLLPQKLIAPFVACSGIDAHKKVNAITKEERAGLLALLKGLPIAIRGTRPIDEAIITKGGVALGEVSPKTMESKLVKGLYFAGEVLDLDAYTGGFNLQIAFSTAVLAGENAALTVDA
ncbi:MAG: NAD(P)/FAD-dependent oxidoreductase [Ruminococcaceae bacterium]|nr:NAD(P)/FAD-dependent oxidoreductase [Oscillospiraceae bacterium]